MKKWRRKTWLTRRKLGKRDEVDHLGKSIHHSEECFHCSTSDQTSTTHLHGLLYCGWHTWGRHWFQQTDCGTTWAAGEVGGRKRLNLDLSLRLWGNFPGALWGTSKSRGLAVSSRAANSSLSFSPHCAVSFEGSKLSGQAIQNWNFLKLLPVNCWQSVGSIRHSVAVNDTALRHYWFILWTKYFKTPLPSNTESWCR